VYTKKFESLSTILFFFFSIQMEIMNESQKKNNKNGTPVSHVPYNASKQHPELLYPEDKTYKHYVDESQKTFNGTPKNGTNREPPNFNLVGS
jgi:hypothetical protein